MPKPSNETAAFRALLKDCQHTFDTIAPAFGALTYRLYDGEDWVQAAPVPNGAALVAAANSTGEDFLTVYAPSGHRLATFELVWGNAPDGSELISDYSETTFAAAVSARFARRFD